MPISITGTGTITGISAGGLPDDCITTAEIAGSAVTPAKLSGAQTGSAPIYGVRAWCVFDGTTTGTNAPTAGGNISSVIRNSLGDYTVTFSTPMSNSNYCALVCTSTGTAGGGSGWIGYPHIFTATADVLTAPTTSSFRVTVVNAATTTYIDPRYVTVLVIE